MTTATRTSNPAWQAEVKWERRYLAMMEETIEGAMLDTFDGEQAERPPTTRWKEAEDGGTIDMWLERLATASSISPGRAMNEILVSRVEPPQVWAAHHHDLCAQTAGTAGTTGAWACCPCGSVRDRPRHYSTGFKWEVARMIGTERADEIVRLLLE